MIVFLLQAEFIAQEGTSIFIFIINLHCKLQMQLKYLMCGFVKFDIIHYTTLLSFLHHQVAHSLVKFDSKVSPVLCLITVNSEPVRPIFVLNTSLSCICDIIKTHASIWQNMKYFKIKKNKSRKSNEWKLEFTIMSTVW